MPEKTKIKIVQIETGIVTVAAGNVQHTLYGRGEDGNVYILQNGVGWKEVVQFTKENQVKAQ